MGSGWESAEKIVPLCPAGATGKPRATRLMADGAEAQREDREHTSPLHSGLKPPQGREGGEDAFSRFYRLRVTTLGQRDARRHHPDGHIYHPGLRLTGSSSPL